MDINISRIQKVRENLETVAFLISKGGAEREAHSKIVDSLVLFSQLEAELKERFSGAEQIGKFQSWGLPLGSKKQNISGDRFLIAGDSRGNMISTRR